MGCNQSKTLRSSDTSSSNKLSTAEQGAISRTNRNDDCQTGGEGNDILENTPSNISKFARRDSIRINKEAIEKRKRNNAGEGGKIREGVKRPLPRAFMKPGTTNSAPMKGFKNALKRNDSIRINKEKMERKKKHQKRGSGDTDSLPLGIQVEVVSSTVQTEKQGDKSALASVKNPSHE